MSNLNPSMKPEMNFKPVMMNIPTDVLVLLGMKAGIEINGTPLRDLPSDMVFSVADDAMTTTQLADIVTPLKFYIVINSEGDPTDLLVVHDDKVYPFPPVDPTTFADLVTDFDEFQKAGFLCADDDLCDLALESDKNGWEIKDATEDFVRHAMFFAELQRVLTEIVTEG